MMSGSIIGSGAWSHVLLDSSPLGMLTNPKATPANQACAAWLQSLLARNVRVYLPEITDYEVRRELLRANKSVGIQRLDTLRNVIEYLPLTTDVMRPAAGFWAQVRQAGLPTAADAALDADVILAAQARSLNVAGVVIATANVGHLSRFVPASLWSSIR